MLADVAKRSRPAANKAHKWLNRLYTWGIKHDRLEESPMYLLTKPFPEGRRDRVLDRSEIRTVIAALPALARVFQALVLLLLLTGQRLREVAGMRWEEIDLERDEWIIPASRTKNKLKHLVPITRQVRAILMELSGGQTDLRGLVLTTNGRTAISGFSKAKAALDAAVDALVGTGVVPGWVYHDLRADALHRLRRTPGPHRTRRGHPQPRLRHEGRRRRNIPPLHVSPGEGGGTAGLGGPSGGRGAG